MGEIKLVEDYAVTSLRNDVRDSLQLAGEQSIVLQLYHAGDPDAVPCPQCGDDVYNSAEAKCTSCYGTLFDGGVRVAMKVWSLYTDHNIAEQQGQKGVFRPDVRSVQYEAFPQTIEHDVIVRVKQWNADGTPAVIEGFYTLQTVTRRSLRTGNRFGQYNWDVVGQKAQLAGLIQSNLGVANYPIVGKQFEESISLTPATATLPAQALVEPDTRVIFYPFEAAPGGVVPDTQTTGGGGDAAFVYRQELPASTWTITHNLGYDPSVAVIINGEEVETDVDYPSTNVVVVGLSSPQIGFVRLT